MFIKTLQYSQEKICNGRCIPSFTEHLATLAASGFSQQQTLFWAESGIYCWQSHLFLPELLWRHELNVRSSHRNSPLKKGVFRNFASFTGSQLWWSLFLIELQILKPAALLEIDSNTDVFLWDLQDHLIWSLRTSASEIYRFTWTSLFNNLGFWLKL